MANNEDNLKSFAERSKEEARDYGKIGGKASGEARRQKKAAKEAAILFASMPALGENKELLKSLGIEKSELTNKMANVQSLKRKNKIEEEFFGVEFKGVKGKDAIEKLLEEKKDTSKARSIERKLVILILLGATKMED